ncbi:MAG TPA: ABC transporter substrate-binding protein [Methylomirabilota bacterium]|nr:ABC transporter substrate-binding protein [Methylomirabilota bacterium]
MRSSVLARILVLTLAALTLYVSAPSQSSWGAPGQPFVIALAGPISGPNAQYGVLLKNGAQLAVNQLTAAGGVDGHPIKLLLADDQMDPKQSPLVAQRLAQDKSVLAVIGHFASTNTLAAMPIYTRVGVPVLSHSTSTNLSGISKWFFRLAVTNDVQGTQLGKYAVERLGGKRVAVMFAQTEGNQTVEGPFEEAVKAAGGQIIAVETHQLNDKDYTAQITKLKGTNPDVVFLNTFFNESALIVRQAREAGFRTKFIAVESAGGPDFLKLGGAAAEGVYAGAYWDPSSPSKLARKFVADYKAAYGQLPEQYGAQAYAAVMIFADVLRHGARTRQAILDYLSRVGTTKGFDTAAGKMVWNQKHDVYVPMVILQVKNGQWVLAPQQQ